MPTFLTTPKMSQALAARVEASVAGRRGKHRPASGSRWVSLLRVVVVGVLGLVAWGVVSAHRQEARDRRELEDARGRLLAAVRAKSALLTDRDEGAVLRDEVWLTRLAGAYEGDFVAPELQSAAGLGAVLARPIVYVRGPLAELASAASIAEAARASSKDSLLLCLLDPPEARTEKAFYAKVRAGYGAGAAATPQATNVSRLGAAEDALPLLLPPWPQRVQRAKEPAEIEALQRDLTRAAVDEATRAAKADVLVAAMDEPGSGPGPTELDGERPHDVRVSIVDLASDKVVLRVRRHVDPSWISVAKRSQYAAGIDGCGLALDVREAAIGPVHLPRSRL